MIASLLRLISIVASLIIIVSFALFAIDEAKSGSKTQVNKLTGAKSTSSDKEKKPGGVRGAIDDASDTLLSPFSGLIDSSSAWVNHGIPALIGLFVYGFLLSLLANYAKRGGGRSTTVG